MGSTPTATFGVLRRLGHKHPTWFIGVQKLDSGTIDRPLPGRKMFRIHTPSQTIHKLSTETVVTLDSDTALLRRFTAGIFIASQAVFAGREHQGSGRLGAIAADRVVSGARASVPRRIVARRSQPDATNGRRARVGSEGLEVEAVVRRGMPVKGVRSRRGMPKSRPCGQAWTLKLTTGDT